MVLAGRAKLRVSKNFFRGHLFVFVEYLCKRSPKIKTKNIKNHSLISAIVNHRNWLDDSPPLTSKKFSIKLPLKIFFETLILDYRYKNKANLQQVFTSRANFSKKRKKITLCNLCSRPRHCRSHNQTFGISISMDWIPAELLMMSFRRVFLCALPNPG